MVQASNHHSTPVEPTTLKGLYTHMVSEREPFLCRAQEASRFTIPGLIPEDGHDSHDDLPTPFQSVGARGVNNLSSKLLLGLFPPNTPFFRLRPDPFKAKELSGEEDILAEIDEALSNIETAVMVQVETEGLRVKAFEALKHLVVAGNSLVFLPKQGGMRVFSLCSYVVKRDAMGNVQTIITKETIAFKSLSPEAKQAVLASDSGGSGARKDYDLYTAVNRTGDDSFEMFQEVEGVMVPDSFESAISTDDVPYIVLRLQSISGESYGRGVVEDYIGDLMSLEGLSQALVEGAAAAARLMFLVNPNGTTNIRNLRETPNAGFAVGNAADISSLQSEKSADMNFARQTALGIEERLSFAFLLNTAIQRSGERVTAEEIRFMAQELEDALGGVLSSLSQEFQLPLVNRLMEKMKKAGSLPAIPKDIVKPTIVTGIEALGRGHDLQRLQVFISTIGQIGGEEAIRRINMGNLIARVAAASSVDVSGLIKTDEQIAQEAQQQQLAQLGSQVTPELVKAAGPAVQQAVNNAQAPVEQQ